jgi:hypothetical protein
MAKEIIPVAKGAALALYKRMQIAIAQCYSIDDCKQIAVQAQAITAYFQQIHDDESVRKFLQIKLRAWRRIGEILIKSGIDKSKCETTAEYIRKIRAVFKDQKEVEELGDGSFRQALKIGELPVDFFDQNVGKYSSIESLVGAFSIIQRREWEASPEGKAELKELEKIRKQQQTENAIRTKISQEEQEEQIKQQQEEAADLATLKAARNAAFDEVGITLDRRDREQMHQIVFLLKKSIHKILRQAAFDNHMTMQSILRAGLMMWFIAHGYNVPTDEMQLPSREKRQAQKQQ